MMSTSFAAAQKATFHKHAKEVDIIITTAAIPGRKSPSLDRVLHVKDMKPGSVIVDLAAAGGGNCALTKPGVAYMTDNGVTIIGYLDFPGRMGAQASSMYATNMLNLMSHVGGKEGAAAFWDNWKAAFAKGEDGDIIVRSILCSENGKAVTMPPPPQPTPVKPKKDPKEAKKAVVVDLEAEARNNALTITGGSAGLLAMSGDPAFMQMFQTFGLAGIAGYQAVFGVTHALHTPLMSVTNAISGLTAVGGLLILGHGGGIVGQGLAHLAVGISSINIVGGFIVSKRMLDLFRKPGEGDHSMYYAIPAGMFAISPFAAPAALYSTNTLASMLCISSILGLSTQKTAQLGCMLGIIGVTGATTSAFSVVPAMYMPGAILMMG